jgi:transcriptional regulator with XRE-family HTH domain
MRSPGAPHACIMSPVDTAPQPTSLADRIKYALQLRKMSGRELASRAGLSDSGVWPYTSGRVTNMKHETAMAIASVLSVSYRWLLLGIGDPEDKTDIPAMPASRAPKTYGQLPGWDEAEQGALKLVPELDWAILGVSRLPADEKPVVLTGHWVAYRAERFELETRDGDELREKLDHDVRARKRRAAESTRSHPSSDSRMNRRKHRD